MTATTTDTLTATPGTAPEHLVDGRNRGAEWIVTPQGWAAPNPACDREPDADGAFTVEVPTRLHTPHGYFRGLGEPIEVRVAADALRDLHDDVAICTECGEVAELVTPHDGSGAECHDCHRARNCWCLAETEDHDAYDRYYDR